MLSWGFVLLQNGRAPKRVTNTRDDKINSPFWRDSFEQRRCLVPASSFCEPNDGRQPGTPAKWHWFALKGDEPRPLFAFAGIWRRWQGPIRKDGPPVDTELYGFLTTFPNALTQTVAVAGHPDRGRAVRAMAVRNTGGGFQPGPDLRC